MLVMLAEKNSCAGLITIAGSSRHTVERFDGARWVEIDTPDENVVITSAGRAFLAANNIAGLMRDYIYDAQEGVESQDSTRRFLAEGANARVFSVGDAPLVVKEKRPGSHRDLLEGLDRMDYLAYVIEQHCPRWISLPRHYGFLAPKSDLSRQFLLMEKVDEGVTIGDVLDAGDTPREPHLGEAVVRIFGAVSPDFKEQLRAQYAELHEHVENALYQEGHVPDTYLTDMKPYNVIVEPLSTPVAAHNFRLTLIDQ